MSKSRILEAAERLRTVGNSLNNPEDVAIAQQYVEELEALATWEVTPPPVMRGAAPEEARAAMLGSTLKKAFRLDPDPSFRRVVNALNREKNRPA